MPLTDDRDKSLHDQKTELKRKTKQLEDERAAHHANSQSIIKKNREHIRQLREENKILHKKLAEDKASDEEIIREAFRNKGSEINAFRNMSAREALKKVDQIVLSKTKRLNAMKHTTQTYQQRLDKLKMEYELLSSGGSSGAVSSNARAREEEDGMKLRALENRLEKTQMKRKEAEKITAHYVKLKKHLQDESLTYEGQLDSLEAEVLKQREVLHNLQVTYKEAQLTKEAAMTEFHQQEELLCKERKERERTLVRLRKMRKDFLLKQTDRKVQQTAIQPDELSSEAQHSATRISADEEQIASTFEEALRRIKDATGITDIQEFVQRFISQKKTHEYLEQRKRENEAILKQLREQKELLEQEVEGMKHSRDAELSHEQQLLEESQCQLQATQQRCHAAKERLDLQKKNLSTIRAGVEHLAEKLQHITLSEDRVAEGNLGLDEFVLELLKQCELKLQELQTRLDGVDLDAFRKQMEEDKFYDRLEENLPKSNTRVKFLQDQTPDFFDDKDKSEEDEDDVVSREALKRQSQRIINANSKKAWKKKKGKF